jgi:hypothetical protein
VQSGIFYDQKDSKKKNTNVDLFVIRVNNEKQLRNARPCHNCLTMMKCIGINRIFYSDNNGNIICEKAKDMTSIQASIMTQYMYGLGKKEVLTKEEYFERKIINIFPPSIKKYNFECFVKHNLVNTLPYHTYNINNNIITIMNKNKKIIVTSKIITT